MRVYFAGADGLHGCYNVRCLFPLQANGWDGDRTSLSLTAKTPENKTKAALASDVVVFHRPETAQKLELARILKQQGKKIVFDNDDTYKDHESVKLNKWMTEQKMKKGLKSLNKYVDQFIIEADLVTASTEFLAAEYRRLNMNVKVLPNCVDPFLYDEPLRNEGDKIRIGITGSVGSTTDMDVASPIVNHYMNDPRVTIVYFSLPHNRNEKLVGDVYQDEYKWLDSVNVEWHPFVDADVYYDKLNSLRLDMMIIPRADNYFNRCKSNLKFLEASMFKIPCVVSGFEDGKSPYQVDPDDANHMVIVTDNQQWIPEMEKLIVDKELRLRMGEEAYRYVIDKYDIEKNAWRWEKAYETIL